MGLITILSLIGVFIICSTVTVDIKITYGIKEKKKEIEDELLAKKRDLNPTTVNILIEN
jgi:hypothetical protein